MYLVSFTVVPTAEHEDFSNIDGAGVLAWIPANHAENASVAESMARDHIVDSRWFIKKLNEVTEVSEDEYEPYDEDKEYFEAVLAGEQAYVFYTYPDDEE